MPLFSLLLTIESLRGKKRHNSLWHKRENKKIGQQPSNLYHEWKGLGVLLLLSFFLSQRSKGLGSLERMLIYKVTEILLVSLVSSCKCRTYRCLIAYFGNTGIWPMVPCRLGRFSTTKPRFNP